MIRAHRLTVSALLLSCLLVVAPAFGDGIESARPAKPFLPNRLDIAMPAATIKSGAPVVLQLEIALPANHHLNKEAPSRVVVTSEGTALEVKTPVKALSQRIEVPPPAASNGVLDLSTMIYYCEDGNTSLCKIRGLAITQPYTTANDGVTTVKVAAGIPD
jgi:hypothetical protein